MTDDILTPWQRADGMVWLLFKSTIVTVAIDEEKALTPILYSLHNCPYAIRARFAILKANQSLYIRSIKLDNKPPQMLELSPKGTVPVLFIPCVKAQGSSGESHVLEQSLDIMVWALSKNDPEDLLQAKQEHALTEMLAMIDEFERDFVPAMNAFACAKRYHEDTVEDLRKLCFLELEKLEQRLMLHSYLFSEKESLVDIALMPFLRKYARIDKHRFRTSPYPKLQAWLKDYMQSRCFSKVMKHYDVWKGRDEYFA